MRVVALPLSVLLLAPVAALSAIGGAIDRHALVTRHNLEWQ